MVPNKKDCGAKASMGCDMRVCAKPSGVRRFSGTVSAEKAEHTPFSGFGGACGRQKAQHISDHRFQTPAVVAFCPTVTWGFGQRFEGGLECRSVRHNTQTFQNPLIKE